MCRSRILLTWMGGWIEGQRHTDKNFRVEVAQERVSSTKMFSARIVPPAVLSVVTQVLKLWYIFLAAVRQKLMFAVHATCAGQHWKVCQQGSAVYLSYVLSYGRIVRIIVFIVRTWTLHPGNDSGSQLYFHGHNPHLIYRGTGMGTNSRC